MRWRDTRCECDTARKERYGAKGDIVFSDTRNMLQRLVSLIVLVVGVWTMLSWGVW
ncbi:hypothetical protein [Haladaptatus sp. T7]|uniref:hypothetical protein n=1 Tax=Haladaptatus sp. T7 TaxID=2029368 RepID=UPI0021A25766|nr:hypothetical protein [Haladaptatus sp. T7]GKZ12700.1 hypothetical protein HAL_05810 [Haladaptatus sp. T7]